MNQAPTARVPTGAETIAVEHHKKNFRDQHGIFVDKNTDNIERWVPHGDDYKTSHMIPLLEMAQILAHNILGEPRCKVRRILDVPGAAYPNANHWCAQPRQEEVLYQPYLPYIVHKMPLLTLPTLKGIRMPS